MNPRKNRKITFLADCDEPSVHHAHSMKRKRMEPILLKPTSRSMRDEVTGNRHHYTLSPVWLPSVMHSMDKGTAVGVYPDLQQKHTQGKGMDNPQWQKKWGGVQYSGFSSHQFEILETAKSAQLRCFFLPTWIVVQSTLRWHQTMLAEDWSSRAQNTGGNSLSIGSFLTEVMC